MSDLVRPASLFGSAPPATTATGVLATIANPPPEGSRLAAGTTLQGVVVGHDPQGHLLVSTRIGTLAVATRAQIPVDSEVTLQVRSSGAQLHVLLMQADDAPGTPPAGSRAVLPQPWPTSPPAAGSVSPGTDLLIVEQSLRAVVQAPAARLDPALQSALPRLNPGSVLTFRIFSVEPPPGLAAGQSPNPTAGAALPPGSRPAPGALPAGATPAAAVGPAGLRAFGGEAHSTAASPTPGSGHGAMASNSAAGPTLLGTVTTVTHAGQPVLQTPLGTVTLEVRAALPPGTRIGFAVSGAATGATTQSAPPAALPAEATLAHRWPALEEAIQVLQALEATAGGGALGTDRLPAPGPRLASHVLFFLAALTGGDIRRWLGDAALQSLGRAGRDDLIRRLTGDFNQLVRISESANAEWRLFAIPVLDGQQVQQLRLFLRDRRRRGDGKDGDADGPLRFVLEVELSRLGELQLDGLVRSDRFDLMLRSRRPLPDFMRRDIAKIFDDANQAAGTTGTIGFQSSHDWQALPIGETARARAGLVV